MIFKDNKQRIMLVVDQDYYPLIFEYKNSHPSLKLKIVSKKDIVDKIGYSFTKDPVPTIVKKKRIEYTKAKKLVNLIRYLNGMADKGPLTEYFNLLNDNDFLTIDEYGQRELQLYQVFLFEMDEDSGIKTLLTNNNINFQDVHISDLDIKPEKIIEKDNTDLNICYFSGKFQQFSYIFADIRKKLEEDSTLQKRIRILVNDANDYFFISSLAKSFGLEFYFMNELPLITFPSVAKMVSNVFENKKLELANEDDDYIKQANQLINDYGLLDLDFEFGYSNLIEILTSNIVKEPANDKGIVVTTKYTIRPKDFVYITNFAFGSFYSVFDDKNFLSDSDLVKLNLTTSYQKTALDMRKKLNYLKFTNSVIVSRVKQHLNDAIYDSHFVSMFNLDKVDLNGKKLFIKNVDYNFNGSFLKESKQIIDANRFDLLYCDEEIQNRYKTYHHEFNGVQANQLMIPKNTWSLTALERFNNCPFKFYIDKLIPLPSDMHNAFRGTLMHKVFEKILHKDYDFEESFQEGIEAYKQQMMRNGDQLTPKEETWIEIYRYWLKQIVSVLLETKAKMHLVDMGMDYELPIYYSIDKYKFFGKIDKIAYTSNGEDGYYTIIDYKSGAEVFDASILATGQSTQLPIYYDAIKQQSNPDIFTHGYEFGGFFIQHVFFNTIRKGYVDKDVLSVGNLLNNTKYDGVCSSSESYWKSFDETAFSTNKDENGNEVTTFNCEQALLVNGKDKEYKQFDPNAFDDAILIKGGKDKLGLPRYNLKDMVKTAKNAILRIIDDIENNRFDIKPSGSPIQSHPKLDGLACRYCDHASICYANKLKDMKDWYFIIPDILKKEVI